MIYFSKGELCEGPIGLDLSQPAFRTGYGFFETLAWNGRKCCHLSLHLKRAYRSFAQYNIIDEKIDYEKVINQVIEVNNLEKKFARLNIFYPVESGKTFPVVCAVPFEYLPDRIWSLWPNDEIFMSSLMQHKSMNRMSYLSAWEKAADYGYDDALLLDFEGNILESSVASLLFKKGDVFFEPQTEYKLPGTAQEVLADFIEIKAQPIPLNTIQEYEHIYALNSLGGVIPVSRVGAVKFEVDVEFAVCMGRKILELDYS
ncbi:aminotransferase class IV [Maridesulfovibrio zosterae]|uniref:aminotransferase class IV n=1 Tax=Maridesulfovibrio zosterae TaxID=82171 RepID=UPI00040A72F7|nr:aminotransferase class IV [Maridesulfovibrio zosterae]